jgi:hypothetical protein
MEEFINKIVIELDKLPSNTIITAKLLKGIIEKISQSEQNLTFEEMMEIEF